jgi:hypothetical protein
MQKCGEYNIWHAHRERSLLGSVAGGGGDLGCEWTDSGDTTGGGVCAVVGEALPDVCGGGLTVPDTPRPLIRWSRCFSISLATTSAADGGGGTLCFGYETCYFSELRDMDTDNNIPFYQRQCRPRWFVSFLHLLARYEGNPRGV